MQTDVAELGPMTYAPAVGSAIKKLLEQALALSADERSEFLVALEQSLEPRDEILSSEWNEEIERCIAAVERGESHLIPGDEVEARIQASLSQV